MSQAITQLEADGLTVQSIGYATPDARSTEIPPRDVSPVAPGVEQAALERHLERVIERGRVLAPALYAYAAEMPSGRSRRQLGAVLRILDSGNAAAAATDLQKLPTYWIPLLSAAASSQDPGRILQEFLKESQRAEEFREMREAARLHSVVLGGAIAVMIFLSIVAIPSFRDIFSGFGLRLPGLTQFVLTLAAWIASGQILIPIVLLAAIAMLLVWATRLLPLAVRERLGDRFGTPLGRSTAIAQFSQFLADLLEAELESPSALRLAGLASGSPRLKRAASRLASQMETRGDIDQPSYRLPLTATVLHALRAELPTTSRVRLLRELSCCHAERARVLLSWTRGIFEPIFILLVGLVVGTTVIALFLPLLSLIQGLS